MAAALFLTQQAHALEPAAPRAAPPQVTAPKLLAPVKAPYPEDAEADAGEQSVELELVVAKDGAVSHAEVRHGAGPAFDQAAQRAARDLRFEPATRDGVPVPARIMFRLAFVPEAGVAPNEAETALAASTTKPSEPTLPAPANPPPSETEPALAAPDDGASAGSDSALGVTPQHAASTSELSAGDKDIEVLVKGRSVAQRMERSAEAVQVIETEEAARESSDLGEVLRRSGAVTVRRGGGLGSRSALSMAGMSGNRVRVFVDGVPSELVGYPFGLANVPVNLVDRVEIYQGVVPVRFGSDALGGAIHLVTDESSRVNRASTSYQVGTYNTHRFTQAANGYLPKPRLFGRASAFIDGSDNDYPITAEVDDNDGVPQQKVVRRFHDGYLAGGGRLTVGLLDRPWAQRLQLSGFASSFSRDIQNNPSMTVPYGEVTFAKTTVGANARYAHTFGERLRLDATLGYSFVQTRFRDVSGCRYDWRGDCVVDLSSRGIRGEINGFAIDRTIDDHTAFGRAQLWWFAADDHEMRFSLAPTLARRRGDDRESGDLYDPLEHPQTLDSLVAGAEWEATALEQSLETIVFAKGYAQRLRAEQEVSTGIEDVKRTTVTGGAGASLRYFFSDVLFLKGSYEYAARLPSADETFGDGGLIQRNVQLVPEHSHNANLGLHSDGIVLGKNRLRGSVRGFTRVADNLIVLLNAGNFLQYENVLNARALGVEGRLGWDSPQDIASLDGNVLYQDVRNESTEGPLASFTGDRIPNLPYLQSGGTLRLRAHQVTSPRDRVELSFETLYVHEFFRAWESLGGGGDKLLTPSQFTQNIGLTHISEGPLTTLSTSLEVHNLADATVYDFYGAQRPGRTFFVKLTLDLHPPSTTPR